MTFNDNIFIGFILWPIIIGIGLSAILLKVLFYANKKAIYVYGVML